MGVRKATGRGEVLCAAKAGSWGMATLNSRGGGTTNCRKEEMGSSVLQAKAEEVFRNERCSAVKTSLPGQTLWVEPLISFLTSYRTLGKL